MNYFFTFLLQPILPLAILLGCLWTNYTKINLKRLTWLTLLGLTFGALFALNWLSGQKVLLAFNSGLITLYLLFFLSQFSRKTHFALFWQTIFAFIAGALWASDPNIHLITNTDVINTPFLLNLSAVILGLMFCIFVVGWLRILFQQAHASNQFKMIRWVLMSAVIVVLLLPLSGNVLLSLMKLQLIDLTKLRLSYVAKVNDLTNYFNYINSLILFILIATFAWKVYLPRKAQALAESMPIVKRQKLALQYNAKRSLIFGASVIFITLASQLYWDRVASLPPALSESTYLTMQKDNAVHIPIESVRDGDLHRFIWVASDGRAIRFFIINRSDKKLSLATVFDACLLCGDDGYVVDGDKLMCVACGVRLFIPSVGKPGGCNPIPIDGWKESENEVIVPKKSLLAGANYFSTVMEIEVVDPVSLEKLTNKKANYRYDYNDNTYFFTSEENQNLFREHPENYVASENAPQENE